MDALLLESRSSLLHASKKRGGHKAGSMAHRLNGHVREQVDESLLIRGLDGEDINQRDELGVLRDFHRHLRRFYNLSTLVRNDLNERLTADGSAVWSLKVVISTLSE